MSVISAPHPRLPDQVDVQFGPADLLGPAFLHLDRAARERGVYLSISNDFDELAAINAKYRDQWYPLPPMFDPALGGISHENAFWIHGVDEWGETAVTQAARLYIAESSLTEELSSMRLFYPKPQTQRGSDEACIVETDVTDRIAGRVCYTGLLWFRPDFRSHGLVSVMPRLTRAYALTSWYPDYMLSFTKKRAADNARAIRRVSGWRNVDGTIRWRGSREGGTEIEFNLVWMGREAVTQDLASFTRLLAEPAVLEPLAA